MIMGNNTFLRGLVLDDVDALFNYLNNKDFMNYSGRINPHSKEELINWIQTTWKEREQKKAFTYAIIEVNEKAIIGTIRLKIVNIISRRADISIGIFNPIFRDKGLGTESLKLLIDFAFNTMNFLSLELKVFTNNKRAISCYEKLGFKRVGVRRKADFVDGEYLDDLVMDLLIEEWKNGN